MISTCLEPCFRDEKAMTEGVENSYDQALGITGEWSLPAASNDGVVIMWELWEMVPNSRDD